MSATPRFDPARYPSGDGEVPGWPFHHAYDPSAPSTIGVESEMTSGYRIEPGTPYGFFTDTSICIGCEACEVACKEWNQLPADHVALSGSSYDNTGSLGATTWRHVKFVEQPPANGGPPRWLFLSDVCKHCEHAGCLEACPTGAIARTEFGTVLIQQDVCNGCKYCVASCPYGVITVDEQGDGKAHKCTLCYDRMKGGLEPACAKACPTDSIQFGPVDDLLARARARLAGLHARDFTEAELYGEPEGVGATNGVGSLRSFALLMDEPNTYNLPEAPTLPARNIVPGLLSSLAAAVVLVGAIATTIFRDNA